MIEQLVRPAHLWVPEHDSTSGAEAADLAASVGINLDGEQRLALDAILAERSDGKRAAFEAALIQSRQNGKSLVCQVIVLADLFLFGAELVVWTAHQFAVTMEAFRSLKGIVEGSDHLRRRIKRISEANGEEAFELTTGQRLLFKARTKSGGRGLTADRVILDEAFELTPTILGSLLPTLSARPNPQVVNPSSAGKVTSDVLRSVRDRGRGGDDPSLVYVEWCAPVRPCPDRLCDHGLTSQDCVLDDEDGWKLANPALGRRITVSQIRAERRALANKPEEFVRERLGWWDEPEEKATVGIPSEVWAETTTKNELGTPAAYAVDVEPSFAFASVAAASVVDGVTVVDVERRRGTQWVAEHLAALRKDNPAPVVLDSKGPSSVIRTDLAAEGIEPVLTSTGDVAMACGSFIDKLLRSSLLHRRNEDLDAAAAGASRRPLGDAWAWSRKSSTVDISPLVAVTLAAWGAAQGGSASEPFMIVT